MFDSQKKIQGVLVMKSQIYCKWLALRFLTRVGRARNSSLPELRHKKLQNWPECFFKCRFLIPWWFLLTWFLSLMNWFNVILQITLVIGTKISNGAFGWLFSHEHPQHVFQVFLQKTAIVTSWTLTYMVSFPHEQLESVLLRYVPWLEQINNYIFLMQYLD